MNACRNILLVLTLALGQPLPVAAQSPVSAVVGQAKGNAVPASEPAAVSAADLERHLADARAELAAFEGSGRASVVPPGTPEEQVRQRSRLLRLLVFSYRQHLGALAAQAEQQKLASDAGAKRKEWSGMATQPPYSILVADGMRGELQSSLQNLHGEEGRQKVLASQIENTKANLAKAGERQRQALEALEADAGGDKRVANWRRDLVALDVRAQGAYLESLLAQSRVVDANVAEFAEIVEFVRRKIAAVEKAVVFQPADLERLKESIDQRRSAIINELESASREREDSAAALEQANGRAAAAQQQVEQLEGQVATAGKAVHAAEAALAKAEQSGGLLAKANPFRGNAAKAELAKVQAEAGNLAKRLRSARDQLQLREREQRLAVERSRNAVHAVEALNVGVVALDMRRSFWELRYAAFDPATAGTSGGQQNFQASRRLLKVIDPSLDYLQGKLQGTVGEVAEQQGALRAAGDPAETAFRQRLLDLLTKREQLFLVAFSEIEETRQLLMRWVADEEVRVREKSLSERASSWLGQGDDWLKAVWNFEFFAVEDSIVVDGRTITGSRGVTVAKVVKAILLVVIGYLLVALLTGFLAALAVRRGRVEETSARIARKWIMAVALVLLLLLGLDVVKIPLTAFAFLGGAIAIGAGFGMQTLLKNLISGVMLLMERPFKPRDIVEVGGIRGEVTDINVRSCTIRDVNGIETLVPNSTFLEQNVTNWTLSNRRVRYTLNVGVAYGSPVRKVADLLLEVAGRHKQVLDEPAPDVLFMDFADNALMFALYVWLEVGPGRRAGNVVLSDLRFMIDASFAEQGIAIPFPQRDVHLDTATPLAVRVVTTESGA